MQRTKFSCCKYIFVMFIKKYKILSVYKRDCLSVVSFLSINFIPQPTFSHSVQNMDPETQKLLRFNQETKHIVEELLQIFQRKEKNLDLLQQTNQILQKLLEISHKKNINFENIQHTMENTSTWSENIKQSNKVLHNYTTTLRDRCHRIQDQLNQP